MCHHMVMLAHVVRYPVQNGCILVADNPVPAIYMMNASFGQNKWVHGYGTTRYDAYYNKKRDVDSDHVQQAIEGRDVWPYACVSAIEITTLHIITLGNTQ